MTIQRRLLVFQGLAEFTAAHILADLFPGPGELVPAPLSSQLIVPVNAAMVRFRHGSTVFGGNPALSMGYGSTVISTGQGAGLTQTTNRTSWIASPFTSSYGSDPLTTYAGQALTLTLADGSAAKGPIATTSLNAAGTGYLANDTGTIDPGGVGTATYRVLTVGGGGAVLTYSITLAGTGYVPATGVDTDTSGLGTGFKVNILTVTQGNGSLLVSVPYYILSV